MGTCSSQSTVTDPEKSQQSGEELIKYPSLNKSNQQQIDDVIQRISYFPTNEQSGLSIQRSEIRQSNLNQKLAKVFCPIHQQKELELLIINKQVLKCYQCLHEQQDEGIQNDKKIQLKDFFQMSEEDYLKTFLKFQLHEMNGKYQKWLGKEQEHTNNNLEILKNLKLEINQSIDKQIDLITESMRRLNEKRQTLAQQKTNCNQLDSLKQHLSQKTSASELEKNIQKLLQDQSFHNKNFELELQGYCSVLKTEVDKQYSLLKGTIPSLTNIISKIEQDNQQRFQDLFSENIITDTSLFKQHKHRNGVFEISLIQNKFIQMKASVYNDYLYFINHDINDGKKYEILMDLFKNCVQNTIELFLLPQSDQTKSILQSKLYIQYGNSLNGQQNETSQLKVYQGKTIINFAEQKIENLKIQICLKDRIFRCKFGSSICSQEDWKSFQQTEKYFFAIFTQLINNEVEIKLKYFREVEEFVSS
ncbi:hypothetical protein ABPG72_001032 [Tetrahymena utriculariae]